VCLCSISYDADKNFLSAFFGSCPALNPEDDKLRVFGLRLTAAI
jgi:hypothetical protein